MSFLGDETVDDEILHGKTFHGKILQQPLAYVPPMEEDPSMIRQPSTAPLEIQQPMVNQPSANQQPIANQPSANQQPIANQPCKIQQPQPPLEYMLENNEIQGSNDEDDNVWNSSSFFDKVHRPLPLLYASPPASPTTHLAIQPSAPESSTSALLSDPSDIPFPRVSSSVSMPAFPHTATLSVSALVSTPAPSFSTHYASTCSSGESETNTENSFAPASSSTRSSPPASPPPSYEEAIRTKKEQKDRKRSVFLVCTPLFATLVCGITIAVLIFLALSGEECTDKNVCFYQANLSSTGVFLIPPSTWVYRIDRLVGMNALTIDPLLWPKLGAKDISSEKRTNTTMLQNVSIFYKPNPRSKTCSGLLGAPRTSPQDFANEDLVASMTNTYPCTAEYWVGIACILVLLLIIWALYAFSKRERDKSESSHDIHQEQEQETNRNTTSNVLLIAT